MMSKVFTWLLLWFLGLWIATKIFFKRKLDMDSTDLYLFAIAVVFFIFIGWLKLAGI